MPLVEVFLLPGASTDLYQRLMDRDIDAAIIVKPPFPIPKTLEWELLRTERLVLIAPGDTTVGSAQDNAVPMSIFRNRA